MHILPKNYGEFRSKDYWNKFFQQLKATSSEYFEWYGEYTDFKPMLFRLLGDIYTINNKLKDITVFHVGCGKSKFAENILKGLPMFGLHFVNCDYSEQIIDEMKNRSLEQNLPQHKIDYQVVDLLKELPEEFMNIFHVVLDKGTLDALLPEQQHDTIDTVKQVYFENIQSAFVKQSVSAYLIISMLQPFVLRTILEHYLGNHHYKLTIYQCLIKDSQMQPFLVDVRFNPKGFSVEISQNVSLVLLNGQRIELADQQGVLSQINDLQVMVAYSSKINKLVKGQCSKFSVYGQQHTLKYMIQVCDNSQEEILQRNTCAVMVIPQGKESNQLYSPASLLEQIGTSRVIIVRLATGNKLGSIQMVKKELNSVMKDLIQSGCEVGKVPYLSDGDELGDCSYIFENEEVFVEEVLVSNEAYRRLVLKSCPDVIQSHFKLGYFNVKNPAYQHLKHLQTQTLVPKKNMLVGIDHGHLNEGYCRTIVSAILCLQRDKLTSVLTLGGGGCTIPQFLSRNQFTSCHVVVEVSAKVIDAMKYFQIPSDDPRFKVVRADAAEFIINAGKGQRFSTIIVDINSKEGELPPQYYFQMELVDRMVALLEEDGILVYNIIHSQGSDKCKEIPLLNKHKELTLFYSNHRNNADNYVIIACKWTVHTIRQDSLVLPAKLCKLQTANPKYQWELASLREMKLVSPQIGGVFKHTEMRVTIDTNSESLVKKKK